MASGGIKVKLGSVSSQASSTSSAVSKLNDKFRELRNTVDDVTESNGLEGKAYRSARTFIKSVINPAITGVITAGDQLRDGVKKLHSDYTAKVDSRSWSVKELNEKIRHYKSEGDKLNHALDKMTGPGDGPATNSLETQISQNSYCLEKYKRIKDHLIEFSGESASFFSSLNGTIADINAAAQQLQSKNITNPSCTVMKTPSSKDLKWAHDIKKRHWEYEGHHALNAADKVLGIFKGPYARFAHLIGKGFHWASIHSSYLATGFEEVSRGAEHISSKIKSFSESKGLALIGFGITVYNDFVDTRNKIKAGLKVVATTGADIVVDSIVDVGASFVEGVVGEAYGGPAGAIANVAISIPADITIDTVINKHINEFIDKDL